MKLLTYNLNRCGDNSLKKCKETILKTNPDIIALQEVIKNNKNNISKILSNNINGYYFFVKTLNLKNKDEYGISLISKYPILDNIVYEFKNQNIEKRLLIGIKIKIKNKIYWVYNTHLQYSTNKYPSINNKQINELYFFFKKKIKNKNILMGDLNTNPDNLYIKKLFKLFKFYNLKKPTYKRDILDYILISKKIKKKTKIKKVLNYNLSNHKPIFSQLSK